MSFDDLERLQVEATTLDEWAIFTHGYIGILDADTESPILVQDMLDHHRRYTCPLHADRTPPLRSCCSGRGREWIVLTRPSRTLRAALNRKLASMCAP